MKIKSEVGKGTTVAVYIPLSGMEPKPDESRHSEIVKGKGTILIVEDNQVILDLCRKVLEESGYEVTQALNGEEAERGFTGLPGGVDLVLMGVVMPKSGGTKTLQTNRAVRANQKFILMSGYTKNENEDDDTDEPLSPKLAFPVDAVIRKQVVDICRFGIFL